MIVDLSDCEFVDSTIIGVLATALRDANTRGGQFSVVLPATSSAIVNRMFDLMRLRDVLPVYESAQAVPAAPGSAPGDSPRMTIA